MGFLIENRTRSAFFSFLFTSKKNVKPNLKNIIHGPGRIETYQKIELAFIFPFCLTHHSSMTSYVQPSIYVNAMVTKS